MFEKYRLKILRHFMAKNTIQQNRSYYFIIALRFVVATVLIPSGLLKIQGKRFSAICPEMYAGTFFSELHNTGIYWKFLGFCQLLTALLLFTQRYTVLAAIMFFGICANIFIFTLSMGLHDKTLIMAFMLTAAFLLIGWDYYRIKLLFNVPVISNSFHNHKATPISLQLSGFLAFVVVVIMFLFIDTYH